MYSVALCAVTAVNAQAQTAGRLAHRMSLLLGAQARMLWIDGTANLTRSETINGKTVLVPYTTTTAGVDNIVQHCLSAGINTIILDVKPISGQVLYHSAFAPRLDYWEGHTVPDFDVLGAFIKAAHKVGIQVDADVNLLSEGHKYFQVGPAYQHPSWQSITYSMERGLVTPSGRRLAIRAEGEPGNNALPELLAAGDDVRSDAPSGMVGLETTGDDKLPQSTNVGEQLNVVVSNSGEVSGIVDSGLLDGVPLSAPEHGSLLTVQRDIDKQWVQTHLYPGEPVRYDMRTSLLPVADAPGEKVACFVDPLNPEVRQYELNMVHEIAANYDIDGLVLDRCRYADLLNDFSDTERHAFELYIGSPVQHWPQDIIQFPTRPGASMIRGPLFDKWLEFRAKTIQDMVADVATTLHQVKPGLPLGAYVGSWYPGYYVVGVNWGSPDTKLRFSWFTPNYPSTGYAETTSWLSPGCYYPIITVNEARQLGKDEQSTVEYNVQIANRAVDSGTMVYPGIYVPFYEGHPHRFVAALQEASRSSEGWMLFDLSYLTDYHWWPYLQQAFTDHPVAPHTIPGLLRQIRSARSREQVP